jgi:calcineurin-like phosphoesterase family protein
MRVSRCFSLLTRIRHFGHGNIMKYCRRPGFSSSEQEKALAYYDAEDRGLDRDAMRDVDFKVSRETVERMDQYLLDGINSVVGENDVLWHLGDFCFADRTRYYNVARSYLDRIRCRDVRIVWGNHDDPCIGNLFANRPTPDTRLLNVKVEGQNIICCHYALAVWEKNHRGNWQLYGHSHSNAEPWLDKTMPGRRSMDVGVDNAVKILGSYRPFSFDEIKKIMDKKTGCSIDHHGND